jgi:hypothetical protein
LFVPRCCLPQTNLRKYSRDADAVLLAERAAYYQPVGVSRFAHERWVSIPTDRQVTSILSRAGYVWIFYRWPDKDESGEPGAYDLTKFVMAARYTEDLEEEFIYRETDATVTDEMAGEFGWLSTPQPFNDQRHYGVDDNGNLTYMTAQTSTQTGIKSYDLDGVLRWEIAKSVLAPGLTSATVLAIAVDPAGPVWVVYLFQGVTPPMGSPPPATLNCAKFDASGVLQFTIPLTIASDEQTTVDGYQIAMQGSTPIVFSTRANPVNLVGGLVIGYENYTHRFWKLPASGGGSVLTWGKKFTNANKRLRNMTFPVANLKSIPGGQDSWVIEYDINGIDNERRVLRFSPTSTEKDPYSATTPTWFGEVYQSASSPIGGYYSGGNKHNDCCDSDGGGRLIVLDGQSVQLSSFPSGTLTGAIEHPRLAQINSAGGTDWTSDPITRYEEPGSGLPNATAAELHVAVSGNSIFVTSDGQYW